MTFNNKEEPFIYGNLYDKYSSQNRLEKLVVKRFLKNLKKLIIPLGARNLLDVGCGEGFITDFICKSIRCPVTAVDIGDDVLKKARNDYPEISFIKGSAYKLPFKDKSFEIVSAIEILEHLEHPENALREFKRVSKKWLVASVPQEPLWRILNMAKFKYLTRWGNTPGHIQHWTTRSFCRLMSKNFRVIKVSVTIPWIITLCDTRKSLDIE
jgi:ubiquinone/menaquinone biosynthesis C-methylase UbiE